MCIRIFTDTAINESDRNGDDSNILLDTITISGVGWANRLSEVYSHEFFIEDKFK